jgi:hypothetical protein
MYYHAKLLSVAVVPARMNMGLTYPVSPVALVFIFAAGAAAGR